MVHVEKNTDMEIVVETTIPPQGKSLDELESQHFEVITVNLGRSTRQTQVDLLQVATDSARDRMLKDREDKATLKAEIRQLRQYISSLVYKSDVTATLPPMLEPPAEQGQLNHLVAYGKRLEEWEEEFVARGRSMLTELYQLQYNARELHLHLQDEE